MTKRPELSTGIQLQKHHLVFIVGWLVVMCILLPLLYAVGVVGVETLNMFGRYSCFAIAAIGLDLVWGFAGILSLCQAFFFTLGAYGMGMYLAHQFPSGDNTLIPQSLYVVYPYDIGQVKGDEVLPWFWWPFRSFPVALILAIVIPAVAAAVIGMLGFISRVKGVYFAILTQAVTVAAFLFFCDNDMFLCGTNGLSQFSTFLGIDLGSPGLKVGFYLATVITLLLVYIGSAFLVESRFGHVLVAVRDAESTLRFQGYRPWHFKFLVFALAGAFAGIGGLLYVPQMQIITPSNMAPIESILMVVWVAVGGRGTLSGAVLGALVVNLAYNFLTSPHRLAGVEVWNPEYWPLVLGLMFVLVVLFIPNGIVSLVRGRRATA